MVDKKQQIEIPSSLTVTHLAEQLQVSPIEIIKHLMKNGVMASVNQVIDYDTAAIVAADFGYEVKEEPPKPTPSKGGERDSSRGPAPEGIAPRPPVVTVMGHVDHGKTSLLDAIRQTNVTATEAGGITQHIGAYQVEIDGRRITFLDTPGHEAFTAMRARGAKATDVAILVVAADDGVMPQTIEAIAHARAAGVPIVVAINKTDKPNANPEKVKQQLAEQNLLIEEWGGDTVCVPISAKRKAGIADLLENILLVADMLELKANPTLSAEGVVIEAKLDKTKGPLATVLVQNGTLEIGNSIVAGETWGKIKAMFNDKGKRIKRAEPATPVEILGLNSLPQAGDFFFAVATDNEAQSITQKKQKEKQRASSQPSAQAPTLDDLFARIREGQIKELNIILKTDAQGSIEPIKSSLERLTTEEVKLKIVHAGSGSITEGDVMLALASRGIIIGFSTRVEPGAKLSAERNGVEVRTYQIIYELLQDIEKALKGMLEPVYAEVVQGQAEVRAVFPFGKKGKVAGTYVTQGKMIRGDPARIVRNGQIVHESSISSLRRFKENATEVLTGFECGIGLEGFIDFQVGDIIQTYHKERQR